jgi:hypothetical protein
MMATMVWEHGFLRDFYIPDGASLVHGIRPALVINAASKEFSQ